MNLKIVSIGAFCEISSTASKTSEKVVIFVNICKNLKLRVIISNMRC